MTGAEKKVQFPVRNDQQLCIYNRTRELERRLFGVGPKSSIDPDLVADTHQLLIDGQIEEFAWILPILARERIWHLNFFGSIFDLTRFKETLKKIGHGLVQKWQNELLMEVHFFPFINMKEEDKYPGWRFKPSHEFFSNVEKGLIYFSHSGKRVTNLVPDYYGCSVLIDVSPNCSFSWDRDTYWLSYLLRTARSGKSTIQPFSGYQVSGNRCWISGKELSEIKRIIGNYLIYNNLWYYEFKSKGLPKVHIESFIQNNVILQLYPEIMRKREVTASSFYVWHEDLFGEDSNNRLRLLGSGDYARSSHGCMPEGERSEFTGFRPIIYLD